MKSRIHVAHFTNAYHPVINGVVRSVSSFRQGLAELGHNVFIFAQGSSDYDDTEPFIFRYPTIELPVANHFPLAIPISPFIDRLLPFLKLDVIHSHHPFLLGQTAVRKAAELDLPMVFTFHTRYRDYSHYVSLNQRFVKEAIDRWMGDYMQQCHHIIVPSDSIRQLLATEYGVTEQVTTLPTGIDLAPYLQADGRAIRQKHGWGDDIVLISAGRLAKEKNWETLLTAVDLAIRQNKRIRLVIMGGGDDREELEAYSRELGIADRVEFAGLIPFAEVPHYLKAADIFVFASITETQGLVTMEALAAGLPVVAVAATGTSDAVEHEKEGLLTANESQALGQAIAEVAGSAALREHFSQAALIKAKSFELQQQARNLLDVYERAIEARNGQQFVSVDRQKPVFKLEWWERLGLDKNPFESSKQQNIP